ncbi:hypothetical protein JRQ81_009890, partial [Phrynocephalus forsythii]
AEKKWDLNVVEMYESAHLYDNTDASYYLWKCPDPSRRCGDPAFPVHLLYAVRNHQILH